MSYGRSPAPRNGTADFCISHPLQRKRIDADFAPDVKELLPTHDSRTNRLGVAAVLGAGFNIYGSISFVSSAVTTICIRATGCFRRQAWSSPGGLKAASGWNLKAKLAASRAAVETLHPGRSRELQNPVYVDWGRIPFSVGSWSTGYGGRGYARAIEPDRRVYLAGDHTSMLVSWQEGPALSAHRAVRQIGRRVV